MTTTSDPQPAPKPGLIAIGLLLYAISVICGLATVGVLFLAHWLIGGAHLEGWQGFAMAMAVLTGGPFLALSIVVGLVRFLTRDETW